MLRRSLMQSTNYILSFLLLLLALSYFYQAPQNPPGFYIDEASIAYNANTIASSGRDEYGKRWPLYFRAFGEYKNPVYIYLLALLFRLFGPSILVARLLSASLTVIAVGLLWLLAYRISRQTTVATLISISAFLTPWLFENSRLVFEVASYPALLVLYLIAVHHAATKERWRLREAFAIASTLTLLAYSYSIGRLFAPLLAFGLVLRGLPADRFVRLSPDEKAPYGSVVISTAEECSDCRLLLKSINYIVYLSGR
jgi:hypothetical protein